MPLWVDRLMLARKNRSMLARTEAEIRFPPKPASATGSFPFFVSQSFLCHEPRKRLFVTIKIFRAVLQGKTHTRFHLNNTMTIQVEQQALLRVMERPLPYSQPQPSHSQSHPPSSQEEEYVLVDFRDTLKSNDCSVEKLRHSTYDDEDSVFTLSTASLSDSDSEVERSVSFADDVVTEEWTRPYTPREEVSKLFYSTEETQR
jgi:hypothetical protein